MKASDWNRIEAGVPEEGQLCLIRLKGDQITVSALMTRGMSLVLLLWMEVITPLTLLPIGSRLFHLKRIEYENRD